LKYPTSQHERNHCILYISFEDDMEKFLDNFKSYYALENEFASLWMMQLVRW